jgi:hypothetical protein
MRSARRLLIGAAAAAAAGCSLLFSTKDFDTGSAAVDASAEVAPPLPGAYRTLVLSDQPIAYWRMGEPEGATAALDETDSGLNETYVGACTLGVDGAIVGDPNTAVQFGDAGCSFRVDSSTAFPFQGTAPFSIEVWIRPDPGGGNAPRSVVSRERNAPGDAGIEGYALYVQGGVAHFERIVNGATQGVAGSIQPGEFTHVIGTYDGAQLHVYIDGVPIGPPASDVRELDAIAMGPVTTIGLNPQMNAHFVGVLDELAIYRIALDGGTALAHYHAGAGR